MVAQFDLDGAAFKKAMLTQLAPGIVIGVLAIVSGFLFCGLRYGADKCGGRKLPRGGYTRRQRLTLFGLFAAFLTLFIIASVIGISNSIVFGKAERDVLGRFEAGLRSQQANMDVTYKNFLDTGYVLNQTLATAYNLEPGVDQAGAALAHYLKTQSSIASFENARTLICVLAFLVSVLSGIFGLLSAMMRRGVLSTIMMLLGFSALLVMWVNAGLHTATAGALASFCAEVTPFTTSTRILEPYGAQDSRQGLAFLATCPPMDIRERYRNAITVSLADDVATFDRLNSARAYPSIGFNATTAFNDIAKIQRDINAVKRVGNFDNNMQIVIDRMTNGVTLLQDIRNIYFCKIVRELYIFSQYKICSELPAAAKIISAVSYFVGIILAPAVVCAILGMKRFKKLPDHLKLNADADENRARNALAAAENEDEVEMKSKKGNAQLSADKWNRVG